MKWLAWCHDNAIKGSFGVDTSYAKIPHGTLLANTLNTVPAPIKGTPTIQKFLISPSNCDIKNT